jgi:hypothetical protein
VRARTSLTPPPAIYCFKKALFLINAIAIRFGAKDPSPFPVPQTSHLPVFADNVLPSILIHLGVIDLSTARPALATLFHAAGEGGGGGGAAAVVANRPAHMRMALLLAAVPETAAPPARTGKVSMLSTTTGLAAPPVPVEGPTPTPVQAYVLRAAAIEACERIVAHAHAMSAAGRGAPWLKDVTVPDLGHWLWAIAKDRADYRALPRFALRDTPFF